MKAGKDKIISVVAAVLRAGGQRGDGVAVDAGPAPRARATGWGLQRAAAAGGHGGGGCVSARATGVCAGAGFGASDGRSAAGHVATEAAGLIGWLRHSPSLAPSFPPSRE